MNNKKILLTILLAFILLIGGASVLYAQLGESTAPDQLSAAEPQIQNETEETESPKTLVPDFTVYDEKGNEFRLSDYIGKPIVLNFWASWCGPCQMEMPDFHEKYQELGNDLHFLMVNMSDGSRETVTSASDFISQNGYTFPVFYDTKSEAAITYGVYSLPTTYFIDAKGHAVAQASGAIDAETLQRGIDMIR